MTEKIDIITTENAADKYVEISLLDFKLYLYRRDHYKPDGRVNYQFELIDEYDIAHGLDEYPTPVGIFNMLRKAKRPDWHPPDKDWVGPELRDENGKPKIVPGSDPANPIRGAFLDLGNGIGVHGTSNVASIGTRASHGCIRVLEDEALELYRRIPVDTLFVIF